MRKIKIFTSLFLTMALMLNCLTIYAADTFSSSLNKSGATCILKISDPETGEKWQWELPAVEENVTLLTRSNDKDEMLSTMVSVDVGEYIYQTLGYPSQSSTLNDDITVTAGLTYSSSASNNTVTIYSAFGSTTPKGIYYAENRYFYWRNPMSGGGGKERPTTNSWSYSGDGIAGQYVSFTPPYAITDCRIRILDMSAYRDVSVQCNLNL